MSKKHQLYDLGPARIGVMFLNQLTNVRRSESSEEVEWKEIANSVARMPPFKCPRYADLPKGAKQFISRCASLRRSHPGISLGRIVREQYALIQYESDKLYAEVQALIDRATDEIIYARKRESLLAEWYVMAAKHPAAYYHPDDMP